jgi:hypothetical protein
MTRDVAVDRDTERERAADRKRRQRERNASRVSVALCNARTRAGGTCRLAAGHGTDHVGFGRCRLHAGNTPAGRTHGARLAATVTARTFGVAADVDPLAAMSLCVRLAVGATQEFRRRVAALDDSAPVDSTDVIAYMASTKQTAQIAKMAIDAGLAEREALMAERVVELIAVAFEESIADEYLSADQRARIVARFTAQLTCLEGQTIDATEAMPAVGHAPATGCRHSNASRAAGVAGG